MKNPHPIKRELYFYVTPNNEGLKKKDQKRRTTVAGIYIGDELRLAKSCCSLKDQFIKAKGRVLAKGRALSSHPERVQKVTNEAEVVKLFINLAKTI